MKIKKKTIFPISQTEGQTDSQTESLTDSQTEGQTDSQTKGQTDSQTEGQTDRNNPLQRQAAHCLKIRLMTMENPTTIEELEFATKK